MNLLMLVSLCFMGFLYAQSDRITTAEIEVRKILSDQEIAWNKGDLINFMKGYWDDENLVFVGSKGPTFGYQNTLASYQRGYPNKIAMGKLHFDILHVNSWDDKTLQLIGKYTLTRSKDQPTGFFTLLFRKINGNWKIVSDHSSAESVP